MKHYLKISCSFLLIPLLCLWAQPVINTGDMPTNPATTITTMTCCDSAIAVNLGSSGANQTWNFTSISVTETIMQYWVTPSSTPFGGTFPTANRCVHVHDAPSNTDTYSYHNLTSNDIAWLGHVTDTPVGTMTVIINYVHNAANYPIHYQDQWYEVWNYDVGSGVTSHDSTVSVVDGWGTVVDVAGSFSCLRVQNHHFNSTWYMGIMISSSSNWYYDWVVPGRGSVVFINSLINESNPNFTMGNFTRVTDVSTDVPRLENPQFQPTSIILNPAYPNPFNPITNLTFSLSSPERVALGIFDVQGREVANLYNGWLQAGQYHTIFDGALLPSGMYFAQLRIGSTAQTQKITLVK